VVDLVLLGAACAVLAVAAGATTALLEPASMLEAAITFGVVACAGVVVLLLGAGATGELTRAPVFVLTTLWAVVAVAIAARRKSRLPRPPRLRAAQVRRHPWTAALVGLAAVALAWQLLVALILPPFAYDAITYHLTIVATWLQQGDLDPTPLSLCCAYYPANAELLFAWPMLFEGSDALVDTVQVGFAAIGALAVAGLARSAGLPRAAATAAGALFTVTPVVLTQAPTNFADVLTTALVLAALHELVRFAATRDPHRMVVAGLATGVVLGTKGTGILWAAALLVAAMLLLLRRPRLASLGIGVAFVVLCLTLGSFWYVRNVVDTGNPVYPFAVTVAGTHVFDGPFTVDEVLTRPSTVERARPVEIMRSWARDLTFWRQGSYDYQQRAGGLGPLWPWLALPLLIPVALALVRRRSPVLLAFALAAVVFLAQPYRWWSRFTLVLAALGAIAIACSAVWAPRPWLRRSLRVAALALALAGVVLSSFEVDPAGLGRPLRATRLPGLIGSPAQERSLGRLFFPEYRFLERIGDHDTVVVDLHAAPVRFVYPLFGSEHTRTVLPADSEPLPTGAWVVTAAGRPLDVRLAGDRRFRRAFAARGIRVWEPRS